MFNSAGNAIDTISGHDQDVVDPTRFVSDMLSSIYGSTSRLALGSDPWCLQRTAQVRLGSKAEELTLSICCPLYPRKQTLIGIPSTSALCHKMG